MTRARFLDEEGDAWKDGASDELDAPAANQRAHNISQRGFSDMPRGETSKAPKRYHYGKYSAITKTFIALPPRKK